MSLLQRKSIELSLKVWTFAISCGICAGAVFGSPSGLGSVECPNEEFSIAVVGDSLADGLWGSTYRAFSNCSSVNVYRITEVSDGLTRTPPLEWRARLDEAADSFNLVIVQLGANDIRNIREGSQRFVFGSPEWFDTYGSRAQILWDELNKLSQTVIWVGLPIVGSDTLQSQYSQVTEVQQAIVLANGGIFYDIRELTMFDSEGFVMNALWDGELVQMRAPDRIHFTEAGYDAVSSVLTQHLINASREADKDAILNSVELQ